MKSASILVLIGIVVAGGGLLMPSEETVTEEYCFENYEGECEWSEEPDVVREDTRNNPLRIPTILVGAGLVLVGIVVSGNNETEAGVKGGLLHQSLSSRQIMEELVSPITDERERSPSQMTLSGGTIEEVRPTNRERLLQTIAGYVISAFALMIVASIVYILFNRLLPTSVGKYLILGGAILGVWLWHRFGRKWLNHKY